MNDIIAAFGSTWSFIWFIVSAVLILTILAYFFIKLVFSDKKGRRLFISSVSKGKFLFIYFASIPLFLANMLNTENYAAFPANILKSAEYSVALIGFKFEFEKYNPLFDKNIIYRSAVYVCFFLVVFNVILFVLSLFSRYINKSITLLKWTFGHNRVMIVGNNPDNIAILNSAKGENSAKDKNPEKNNGIVVIADALTNDDQKKLYQIGVPYIDLKDHSNIFRTPVSPEQLVKAAIRQTQRMSCGPSNHTENMYRIIINTGSDERNLQICRKLCGSIDEFAGKNNTGCIDETKRTEETKRRIVNLFTHIQVHVFGDAKYETLYLEMVKESHGVIRYVNKYKQIAIDFMEKYPLTQFMDNRQIDTGSFTLRKAVGVNVIMLGFGRTNRQIFLTSVANNQFLGKDKDGREVLKPVRYHIFDKNRFENDRNLNHNYYRYRNEFFNTEALGLLRSDSICDDAAAGRESYISPVSYPYDSSVIGKNTEAYLPLPMLPAEEYFHHLDISAPAFYSTLKTILSGGRNDLNYIVISCGSDLENIDLAEKIIEKRKEWGLNNVYIFTDVRSGMSSSSIFKEGSGCFLIGDERKTVYNLKNIVCSDIMKMALERNSVYESSGNPQDIATLYKWYIERTQIERDSNFYAILSLRSKLHMMGFDYAARENCSAPEVTKEEYFAVYAKGDMPERNSAGEIIYPKDGSFPVSPRRNMAIQEHYRWNSYTISQGIIPSTIEQIRNDGHNGKDYAERRHGNLTTFEGLHTFYELTGSEVIHYDYQLMDELYDIIPKDKKVVRRFS